ncbi:MAG: hypothetical protein R3E48_19815 [Burkholderiaceae bacterium]
MIAAPRLRSRRWAPPGRIQDHRRLEDVIVAGLALRDEWIDRDRTVGKRHEHALDDLVAFLLLGRQRLDVPVHLMCVIDQRTPSARREEAGAKLRQVVGMHHVGAVEHRPIV